MTDEEVKRVVRAEELAGELPIKEPDWSEFEKRVKDGLATPPASDDALFVAPFPEEAPAADAPATTVEAPAAAVEAPPVVAVDALAATIEAPAAAVEAPAAVSVEAPGAKAEPAKSGTSGGSEPPGPGSERAPVSLAELARATVARRGDAQSSSIAKESLALASQRRAQTDEAPAPAAEGTARRAITIPPERKGGSGDVRTLWMGVGIAAVGLAAGFGLYLKGTSEPHAVIIAQAPAPLATAAVQPAAAEPPAAQHTPSPGLMIDQTPHGVSLDQLAGEAEAKPGAPAAAAPAVAGGGAPTAAPASPSARTVVPERVVLEEDKSATPAAGPATPTPTPASAPLRPAELNRETGTGDRPSAGAAQAAVGAVLGAARSCIAGHPKASSATLVFGSSGEVASVSVGGPAAGTPAAGCIESALKKARVQPFAAPTFSLAVTVRPP